MDMDQVRNIVDIVQENKPLIAGVGIIFSLVVFYLSKGKSRFNPYTGSALAGVGKNKLKVPLVKKIKLSHDTYRFIFALPKEDQTLGIDVGQHIAIHQEINGEEVVRKYTPVSPVTQRGTFDLVIKVYRKNVHPRFPEGGVLSQWIEDIKVGDSIFIKGPTGRLVYQGFGSVKITNFGEAPVQKTVKRLFMIGGGTGITPLYQVVQAIANKTDDKTEVHLLYANKTEDDILIREELEAQKSAGNLQLSYTLDCPPENWAGYKGFISSEMLEGAFPKFHKDTLICTCGPGPMNKLVIDLFKKQGYTDDNMFSF